jgi:CheY-like chemotaxis protein
MEGKRETDQENNQAVLTDKNGLLARMSHEIRTPLNVVVGIAHILQAEGHSPQKQKELLKTLLANANHLTKMVIELIEVVKTDPAELEGGMYPLESFPAMGPDLKSLPLEQEHKKSFRVLLVEDFGPNTLVASSYLKLFGYNFDIAQNGREALDMVRQKSYSLILMDIQMPEMDGFEATAAIRAMEKAQKIRHTPIVGMTACAMTGDREKCLQKGMDNYISKPFDASELKNILTLYA